jgi:hypothetical protein
VKTLPFKMALHKGPKEDPYFADACVRIKQAVDKLIADGIIDANGKRIRTDLPADMQEGSDRDFGG